MTDNAVVRLVEVNSADLEGPALHWLIAQIEGREVNLAPPHYGNGWRVFLAATGYAYRPSTDWVQGGVLADKYSKGFGVVEGSEPRCFRAFARDNGPEGFCRIASGPTILLAVCRAIVKVHLGDLVRVPQVLAQVEWSPANAI